MCSLAAIVDETIAPLKSVTASRKYMEMWQSNKAAITQPMH